jgi:hypothetical protein
MVRAHSRACIVSVNAREQSAQLDRCRQLAALLEGGTDRGGFCLSDDEHPRSMGTRPMSGKSC